MKVLNRKSLRGIVVLCVSAACPSPGAAQESHWQLDIAGSRIELDTTSAINTPSVAGLAEFQSSSVLGRVQAGLTAFQGGAWSIQGRGDGAAMGAPFGRLNPLRLEVSGGVAGSRHSSGFESGLARGDLRLHLATGPLGLWGGFSGSAARNSFDEASVAGMGPTAGLWGRLGAVRATASYQHQRIEGETVPETNATASHSSEHVEVTLYGGVRGGSAAFEDERAAWAGASVEVWFQPRMALVASAGSYPSELLQGLPGGRFVSLGFRIADRRKPAVPPRAITSPIVFSRAQASRGGIGFDVPGAATVEVAGDWNAWTPTPLTRVSGNRWVLDLDLEPGVYRFNLRIDGTGWLVPSEVPSVDDGFGGHVGLLIVS